MKVPEFTPHVPPPAGAFGAGQSWLVGYEPLSALVSGVQGKPSRAPEVPMHVPLAHTPGVPPAHIEQVLTGSMAPVRYIFDWSGRFRLL
jgi:hypothetical protein